MKEIIVINMLFTLFFIFSSFFKFNYYLSFLITMEMAHMMFIYFMINYNFSNWVFFLFLMYSVCEGVLGLLIMISMDSEFGHQKIMFINLSI